MKVLLLKENLQKGLSVVERITGKNISLPVLNNVLISTDKNFLVLTTTNLEIAINYRILSKIEQEGKTTILAKFLYNFISFLPDKKITLEEKDNTLSIECEDYKTKIKGFNPEEFPIIPKIKSDNIIILNSSPFYKGLSQVIDFCISTPTKPELSGIYFQFQKDRMKLVATDSFRLAEKTIFYGEDINIPSEYSFILPQRTAREIINILSERTAESNHEEKFKIYFSPNQILFEFPMPGSDSFTAPSSAADSSNAKDSVFFPQIQLVSRLIEGEYPDYQEIIPKKCKTEVVLPKDVFLNQIKTAGLFSGKVNEVKIKVSPEKGKVEIFSQHPELGENKSQITAKIKGQPVKISFNYKFLIDGLLNIKSQEMIFELNGGDSPAILKPVGDASYIYVVMPMNIASADQE